MRRRQIAVWALVAAPWVATLALAWHPWSSTWSPPVHPGTVAIFYSFGFTVAAAFFVLFYPLVVFLGGWLLRRRAEGRRTGVAFVLFGIMLIGTGLLTLACTTAFGGMGWPLEAAQLRTPNGRVYRVHRLGISYVEVLSEEIARTRFTFRVRVAGVGDFEYCNLLIVRPEGEYDLPASGVGIPMPLRLAMSRDGRWVALLRPFTTYPGNKAGCTTELAYDTRDNRCYSGDAFTGTLDDLSPFFLIGPHDTPNAQDAAAMLYTAKNGQQYAGVSKNVSVLARDARHRNPEVRALAVALLAWSGEEGVPVLQRLTSAPDLAVRQVAAKALKKLKPTPQQAR